MKFVRSLLVIAVFVGIPASAAANGLVYNLPADGSQAVYDMTMHVKKVNVTVTGTLTISSVGKAKSGGKDCRWIEITVMTMFKGQNHTMTSKVLIPEGDLGKGMNPFNNPQKGWVHRQNENPKKITDFSSRDVNVLPSILSGPLKSVRKLSAEIVDTKLGKLKCSGEAGKWSFRQGDKTYDGEFESRLHAKSPFGVTYAKMTFRHLRDQDGEGVVFQESEMTFRLKSVSKNAKSKLPNQN